MNVFLYKRTPMNDSPYKKLNRIIEVYNLLNKQEYTTKVEIKNRLKSKFGNATDRSIERDLKTLRNDFGLAIEYKHLYGYYIDEEQYTDVSKINNLMNLLGTTLFRIKHASESDFIYPEVSITGKGNHYLEDFHYAISKKHPIKMTYKGYWDTELKHREVAPLLLKEYNQRWYVLADKEGVQRVYSLDRIESLRVFTDEKSTVKKPKEDVFKNIIGVSQSELKPEKVELLFTPLQGMFIKSLKIHHTQKIISDDSNGLKIELFVGINWELKEQINKHGKLVKVLSPKHLVDEIKNELTQTISHYE